MGSISRFNREQEHYYITCEHNMEPDCYDVFSREMRYCYIEARDRLYVGERRKVKELKIASATEWRCCANQSFNFYFGSSM